MMREFFKSLASRILVPLTRWYLRKDRTYQYQNIIIKVLSGVFHPGLFPSTRFLISYLNDFKLDNKSFLELGCGTGLISIVAAKKGARVIACDLNLKAVENCKLNAMANATDIQVYHSDLFQKLPNQKFDWVVINPPYYARSPENDEELAWYCGENFEFFHKLFAALDPFIHAQTMVIMVLTIQLDIDRIKSIAKSFHFQMELKGEQNVLFDGKDLIFKITTES